MTDAATIATIGARIDGIGGKWMGRPVMAAGATLGFTGYPWPFYMVGRGGVLAACVLDAGLSPVEAVLATEGEGMAAMYGWQGPFPDPDVCKPKKAPAEAATNERVGAHYSVLHVEDLAELGVLLGHLEA